MTSRRPDRRPIAAAVTASLLMLASGLTYHVLAARLEAPLTIRRVTPEALEGFPMRIGDWTGRDVPLDETIVNRTGTDAHINRRYSRPNGSGAVSLYVGCGVRIDEVMIHRPEGCYPVAGWQLKDHQSVEFPVNGKMKLPCTILQFARNELHKERATVLHYWIADGQLCCDVSLLRSRLWRLSAKTDSVAQVQIVASSTETLGSESAMKLVCAFAVESAPSIARLFEDIETSRKAESLCRINKEANHP